MKRAGECTAPDFSRRSKSGGVKKCSAQAVSRALHFEDAKSDNSARGRGYFFESRYYFAQDLGKRESYDKDSFAAANIPFSSSLVRA